VATYPHPRRTDQFPPFSPVYGFNRSAELNPGAGLHFNKGDCARAFGDQVQVAVAVPETALEHPPALSLEPPLGDSLPADTQYLVMRRHGASITPLFDRAVTVLSLVTSL
jgi:hypothetical protein